MKKSVNPLVYQNEVTFDVKNQMINDDVQSQVDPESEAATEDADDEEIKKFVPEWDISFFFNGIDDPEIAKTQKMIIDSINDLIKKRDDIPQMKAYELLSFIRDYEDIAAMTRNLKYFASLNLCTQRNNNDALLFDKQIEEFCNKVYDGLGWIHHALFSIPDEKKIEFIQSRKLKNYHEWLLGNLIYPPSVSESVARAIRQMNTVTTGWDSLYNQMVSKLKFTIGKKTYTYDEISELAHADKDKATRNKALKVMSEAFTSHGYIFTQTLNSIYKKEDTLIKVHINGDNEEEYRLDAIDMDGLGNGLDRETILGVATAVTDSYLPVSQRFYKLLAKMHGKQSIDYNDRLQNPVEIDDVNIPWIEAVQMALNTLYQFSEEMAVTGLQIVNDGKLIHAKPMEGKDSGAFCIRGIKPCIFLNYKGGYSSLLTFMHEFGHAIHHVLSELSSGFLNDSTPISMSEVASIFNEKLIFNKLLSDGELTNKKRLYLLIEDVNRQIADIHRQIAFSKFEARAFRERKSGELSEERFTQIYSEDLERYLGFPLQNDARFGWMGIPHIFNSPFYVRYYAFAGLIVNKLWQVYVSGKFEDFDERYVDMLSNTGVESIEDLLEPFELDINSPDFWTSAIDPIIAEIDEIERLAKLEGLL